MDRIRKVNTQTSTANVVAQSYLGANANINGLDVSANGTLYAADFDNDCVYKIYEDGRVLGNLAGKLNVPGDVEQSGVQSIQAYVAGTAGPARFQTPFGICVDSSDNIFVADATNRKVKRLSSSGRVKVLAGSGSTGIADSDSGLSATFSTTMRGICVDHSGIIYVADAGNHCIRKIFPNGKTVRLAGAGVSGFVNDVGPNARFNTPNDVAVDNSGNVYVADTGNNAIRKITPSGVVTILAGGASGLGTSGLVNGNGIAARFNACFRVAMDPSNQFLYVMDGITNHAIRKVSMSGETTSFMNYNGTGANSGDICVDKSGFLYVLEANA